MIFRKIVVFGMLLVLLVLGTRFYLGYRYFYKYGDLMSQAESIEGSFPQLEANLKKAASFAGHPFFYMEMGRLYLDMALAENQFGTAEKRDFYLDQARENLVRSMRANPIYAYSYFEMGKVYMLYNYPLLTYMEKAKLYFRKALELKPADEFLNENIVYIYLTQWELLREEEKDFIEQRMEAMRATEKREGRDGEDGRFVRRLQRKWKENFGEMEGLKEILGVKRERDDPAR